jgi:hypothetical protein
MDKELEKEDSLLLISEPWWAPQLIKIPVKDPDGDTKEGRYFDPIGVNFRKIQVYSDFFDLEEIILFEFFVMLSVQFGNKQFYQQMKRIQANTRLGKDRIQKVMTRLKSLGILSVQSNTFKNKNLYKINYSKIIDLVPQIYNLKERPSQYISEEYAIEIYTRYFNELSFVGYRDNRYEINEETE